MNYKEFRKDGWPLCPQCGEDELFSKIMMRWDGNGERPTVEQCLKGEMACYKCSFSDPGEFSTQVLIGKTLGEAAVLALPWNYIIRVTRKDGHPVIGTRDYRPDRINVAVVDGKIAEVINVG